MILAHLAFVNSEYPMFSHFLGGARQRGMDVRHLMDPEDSSKETSWEAEWTRAKDLVHASDAFFLTDWIPLHDKDIRVRVTSAVERGSPAVILLSENGIDTWNTFLQPFGIGLTRTRLCSLSGTRVVRFRRGTRTFFNTDLFLGSEEVEIQQPNAVTIQGDATPVLMAPHDQVLFVDGRTDFPVHISEPAICAAEWCNASGGRVLAIAGSNLHDMYITITGQLFPGIISNERFAENVLRYLELHRRMTTSTDLSFGESDTLEFKETYRFDVRQGKNSKVIELEVIKAIAGFLNARGGTLVIGVADDGQPLGLYRDKYESEDKMTRAIADKARSLMGADATTNFSIRYETHSSKRICCIECKTAESPVYVVDSKIERFFVRDKASTVDLPKSQIYSYCKRRFG